ncbi:hypothetical protein SAMN05216275_13330 [Streptosporangium canum]|uniref:Uncharacterized protein n=1 Tax=Streptosporangium canum TaxID=324952 RepID=A0A1I4BV95_9ACTN|nr:hypothetical protein [Streptosporangium canum]SFK72077.1 hypothetical protein SAMN05216275_13330 [Streptosporangium canum]
MMKRDDTAQGVECVAVDLSVVEDLCTTFTTHADVGTVASLIGAVPLAVDYRSPEALTSSTATIIRWGDGILITHPYYGDECARQEVMSVLSRDGHLAVCLVWGGALSLWRKTHSRMDPWYEAGASLAYFAYAADGRLEVGFDPYDFDSAAPSVRCGWNTGAVDVYLHDLDFTPLQVVTQQSGSSLRPGRHTISRHKYACVTLMERIAGATFPADVERPDSPDAGFTVASPVPAMSDAEFAHFMGPPQS